MSLWGELVFDNDAAIGWARELGDVIDLSLVEAALDEVEAVGDDYLDLDVAAHALAACEVLARLRGNVGYRNAYTELVDQWVQTHQQPIPRELLQRAVGAIDRIVAGNSALSDAWKDELSRRRWVAAMADIRRRVMK